MQKARDQQNLKKCAQIDAMEAEELLDELKMRQLQVFGTQ